MAVELQGGGETVRANSTAFREIGVYAHRDKQVSRLLVHRMVVTSGIFCALYEKNHCSTPLSVVY